MTGSVALDVVIGLVFVYTLYSLLTTTITELFSTWLRFRSRFLVKGIQRMLDDGSGTTVFSKIFLHQPLIRYLASEPSWFAKMFAMKKKHELHAPAYLTAANFSKNLIETLKAAYSIQGTEALLKVVNYAKEAKKQPDHVITLLKIQLQGQFTEGDFKEIETQLKGKSFEQAAKKILDDIKSHAERSLLEKIQEVLKDPHNVIGHSETISYIKSLLQDANNDLEKFKAHLEQWYDDTMDRVSGWYKKRVQIVTLVFGGLIAIFFNVDTGLVVEALSHDPAARAEIVKMATAYIESHPIPLTQLNGSDSPELQKRIDSLLQIKKEIEKDVASANNVLGLGWTVNSVRLLNNVEMTSAMKADKSLTAKDFLQVKLNDKGDSMYVALTPVFNRKVANRYLRFTDDFLWGDDKHILTNIDPANKFAHASRIKFFFWGFWGYLLTAIALSLGAPFWFDILNKLVKLRTSVQAGPADEKQQQASSTTRNVAPATTR